MDPKFVLSARLFFESKKKAQAALESVKVELGEKFEKRSKTKMGLVGGENAVLVNIDSFDAKSLRASANSYLKLFLLSEKIMEVC